MGVFFKTNQIVNSTAGAFMLAASVFLPAEASAQSQETSPPSNPFYADLVVKLMEGVDRHKVYIAEYRSKAGDFTYTTADGKTMSATPDELASFNIGPGNATCVTFRNHGDQQALNAVCVEGWNPQAQVERPSPATKDVAQLSMQAQIAPMTREMIELDGKGGFFIAAIVKQQPSKNDNELCYTFRMAGVVVNGKIMPQATASADDAASYGKLYCYSTEKNIVPPPPAHLPSGIRQYGALAIAAPAG